MFDNIKIRTVQIVLFFPLDTHFKSIDVVNVISSQFNDLFTTEPNMISLPINAPVEIPRIMYNEDGKAQFNIGTQRADLTLHDEIITNFDEICGKLKNVIDSTNIPVFRVAIVATADFANTDIIEFSKEKISSDKVLSAKAFDMGWLCQYEISGINVNKWTRIILSDELPTKARNIVVDLNTAQDKPIDWKTIKLDDILKLLFSKVVEEVKDAI